MGLKEKVSVNKIINVVLVVVLGFVVFTKLPGFIRTKAQEGTKATEVLVKKNQTESIKIPQVGRQVVVFWATWCPPCEVELSRLNKMIEAGQLQPQDVLAVSVQEEESIVTTTAKKRNYKFQVLRDPYGEAAQIYKVAGTPTVVFINENQEIEWTGVGVSPTLEFRVSQFFKN